MTESVDDARARLLRELPDVTARAGSLHEVAAWLTAQPGVVACRIDPTLLKSHPPQRLVHVDLATPDGQRTVSLRFREHASGALDLVDAP